MGRLAGYPRKLTKRVSKDMIEAVASARNKLAYGKTYRMQEREDKWEQSERQYEGDHWFGHPSSDLAEDQLVVNMSFSTINTIIPYVTASDPKFILTPYSGDATHLAAAKQQAFLNRVWRSRKLAGNNHLRNGTTDALIYGDGWIKAGYDIVDKRVSDSEYAEIAELWVARVDVWDMWLDPASDGLHNARWVCQRLRLTRAELEANPLYHNTDDDNVSYGLTTDDLRQRRGAERAHLAEEVFDGSEFAELYEYWDLVNHRMIVFSEGERPVRWVEDVGESLLVQIGNYRIPGSPYHMGEMEQIWSLQQEINKTRSQMAVHRRRNVQKWAAREDGLAQGAVDALRSDVVNEVVLIKGDTPIENTVQPLAVPTLTADSYNISDLVQRDIYEITGVNEYLRGATPEIRRTATEASIIEGASNIKTQHKLRMVEGAAREIGTLLLGLARDVFPQTEYDEVQLFLTGREAEMVARAEMGQEAADAMDAGQAPPDFGGMSFSDQDVILSPTLDMWQGEYEVEVEQSSTELRNPVMREQKYRDMATEVIAMAPALMQMGVPLNIKRFLELWFEAAQIDDVDALFEQSQPMMPQMGGMMDPAMMMGGMGGVPGPEPGGLPAQASFGPEQMGPLGPNNTGALEPESE